MDETMPLGAGFGRQTLHTEKRGGGLTVFIEHDVCMIQVKNAQRNCWDSEWGAREQGTLAQKNIFKKFCVLIDGNLAK